MPETQTTALAAEAFPATTYGAAVAGLGTALPDKVVPNEVVAERIGKDENWIYTRTGITERRFLDPETRLSTLAAEAARNALADAGVRALDVDMVLVATASHDDVFPAVAAEVCGIIGSTRAAGLDVSAACTGFLSCLQLASGRLDSGRASAVLVIGAEKLSALTDPRDKRTAICVADGAGALCL